MARALILKFSALGDVFMALPHIDALIAHHTGAAVWLLTTAPYADLFANHPTLRTAILDRNRWFAKTATWRRLVWIRRQRFSAVYDLQGNRTSRLLTRFSGAPVRVGTQPRRGYNFHPDIPYTQSTQQNVFDRLNETLTSAGLPPAAPGATLYPSEDDTRCVNRWRDLHHLKTKRYALLHAGSSSTWLSKRWSKERFQKLAGMIQETGIRVVWVGGDADRDLNRYLAQYAGIDATNQFSVLQLYLLGKNALFAVASDSGPMHILSAAGIPVYGFFGPTSWVRSHAVGQKARALFGDVDCSPCFSGSCPPERAHICLESIEPEAVFSTIQRHIGLGGGEAT
jgi:heptosyltransferase I